MEYQAIAELSRERIEQDFANGSEHELRDSHCLIFDPDWRWAQDLWLRFFDHRQLDPQ
jgi:hypothetical protein